MANSETAFGMLASVSDSLNKASDFLSSRISEVESALAGYKLGVEAWVKLSSEEHEDGLVEVCDLGYGKREGKWGLLVVEYYDHDPDNNGITFLRDAPRELRLDAVDKLPDLIKELVRKATEVANKATLKAEAARQIAAGLSKKQSKH